VQRGAFGSVTPADLGFFSGLLGEGGVLTAEADLAAHNTDWLGSVRGESKVLLRPRTTEQVSEIIRHCNERKLAVCPQGGNTGLVGGSVPVFDEVILSTSRMTDILSVDPHLGVLHCQAGCVLQTLDQHLEQHGLMMPLDLGAKGSCQVGGNVSTNAGGLRLVRYGSLQHAVLGLEAVLPSGQVLDLSSGLRKDNTGYHLKHLLIGAEGTLGVVTKVSLLCPARPASVSLAMLSLSSLSAALAVARLARGALAEVLSSLEFVDAAAMAAVEDNLGLRSPVAAAPCYVLVETSGSNAEHDQAKLEAFLETCLETPGVLDGTLATEPSKVEKLWQCRERIAEATLKDGYVYKYDVSVPLPQYYTLVEQSRQHLGGRVTRCCGYGHLGDGNLHLNISAPEYDEETAALLEPWIFERTAALGGSVSAEHGLGFKKRHCARYTKSAAAVALMQQVKKLVDPNGIMNPYKVLPEQ